MFSSTHRAPRLLLLALVLLIVSSTVATLLTILPRAEAAIDNNQPTQAFAAYGVDCIRTGADNNVPSEESPRFAATCYGSSWDRESYEYDTPSSTGDAPRTDPAVVGFGDGKPDAPGEPGHVTLASLGTNGTADGGIGLGAVYGLAYSSGLNPAAPSNVVGARLERTFVGAYTKRITRFGVGGPGAIYVLLPNGDEQVYVTVPDVVNGPNGLPGDPGDGLNTVFPNTNFVSAYSPVMGGIHSLNHDDIGKPLVGRTSLADVELTPDERQLLALNLNNQRIYVYDTWSANPQATQTSFAIPASTAACPGGDGNFRPFGLHYDGTGNLYVGYVCSAETSQNRSDLRAGVLRVSAASVWSRVLDFALAPFDAQRTVGVFTYPWQPWSNTFSNDQPIVADLEITERGDLVLGLRDRTGDTGGTELSGEFGVANGDLLIAPANGSGGWNVPSSAGAEYFTPDQGYNTDYQESLWGSTAYIPGNHDGSFGGEVLSTQGFAYREETGGAAWFNTTTGQRTAQEELYRGGPTTLAKAAGLGDVELLCAWRAIGNRLWRDTNANGVQDAGEPSISGVRMQLIDPTTGAVLSTVTSGGLTDGNDNWRFYIPPWQTYAVRIDPTMFQAGQPLAGLAVTTANAGGNDATDSDADSSGRISVPAGNRGNVDLSFDIGLTQSANITVDKSGPATANAGQQFDYTITVTNQGPAIAANVQAVDTLPANVSFVSATPVPTSQSGQVLTWNLGSLNSGQSVGITVRVQVQAGFSGTLTNQVTVTTTTPGDSPGDNSDTVITTVNAPNLALTKSCPATVAVGQNATFTIGYQNTGSGTFANVSILDTLPPGFTYISATPTAFTSGGNPLWLLFTIGPGASGILTVLARAEASAVNTTVTNQVALQSATPSDSASADNAASCTTQVVGADVSIVKSGPATVLPGGAIAYTLVATNNGPAPAANVTVQDTFPAGVFFVNATPAPSTTPAQNPQVWNLGTLAPGQSATIQVNAQASAGLAGGTQLVNTATITTSTPGDNPGNNSSTVTTTVIAPNVYVLKDGPATVVAGDQFSYTLTVGNNGTAAAADVVVIDTPPTGFNVVSGSAGMACPGDGTCRWSLGTLAPGQSVTLIITGIANPSLASGATLTNQADVSTTTPGDNPADNSDTALTTVQRADVRITKSSPTSFPVSSGQSVTYYLDFTNAGPADAQNVVITDSVPAQISAVSWSCTSGCASSGTGSSISVNVGSLAVGASGRITVTGTATTATSREDFTNTGVITTSTPETDTTNNESSVPGAVWTTDLQIIKDASAQVIAGTTFSATLTYRNNGPAPALAATIADTLPAGVTFVSSVPAPTSQAGQNLSWNVGTLADQVSGSIALTLQADPALTQNRTLINNASISTSSPDRDSSNNQDDATTIVIVQADLGISKSGPARVDAGEIIAYSLTYRNDGPSVARSVVVTDTLPVGVTFISSVPAPTTNSGGVLTWALGDLAPNALDSISILVGSSLTQTQPSIVLTNAVVIGSPTPDPDPSNNQDNVTTTVETVDLIVTKTMPATAIAGQTFSAVLTLQNAGPAIARSVVFSDTIPAGLTYVSATPAPSSVSGQVVTWNVGNMAANANLSFGMVLRSAANTPDGSRFTNTAEATTRSVDRDLTNNQASAITQINREADLRITKSVSSPGPLLSGAVVTYTLTFRNDGPSVASSVVVTDTLPPGFAFTSASPAPTTNSGGVLTWALGDLAPNTGGTLRVIGVLTTSQPSEIKVNTATIGSPTNDPTPGNNTSTVSTEVQTADVSVVKTANPGTVYAGETITYTLLISNAGPAAAANVVLTDTLPAGVTFVSASPAAATNVNDVLTWNVGTLANGQSRTYTVTVTVNPNVPAGSLINRAVGQTVTPDRDPTNNEDDTTTPVTVRADLSLIKTGTPGPIRSGAAITYTLTYQNTGPSAASGVVITDTLPAGFTLTSASPAPTTTVSRTLTWAVGDLAVNASGVITLNGTLTASGAGSSTSTVVNTATVDSPLVVDPTPGNNTDDHPIPVQRPDLRVTKTDGVTEAQPGDRLTYTLSVENVGTAEARGVVLTEQPPAGATVMSTDWTAQADGSYTFALGTLAAGAQRSATFVIQLPNPFDAATVRNVVQVGDDGSTGPDPTPGDTTDEDEDQLRSGSIGDRIWFDADEDGTQDAGEIGMEGVLVQLLDPQTLLVIAAQITGPDGAYRFTDLRMGDYAVQVAPSTLQSGPYAGYRITTDPLPVTTLTPAQPSDMRLDIGLYSVDSTAVTLASLSAQRADDGSVTVRWQTVSESNNAGFRLMRATTPDLTQAERITYLPSQGSQGGRYTFTDRDAPAAAVYWLVAIEFGGHEDTYGPLIPRAPVTQSVYTLYLPLTRR